MRIYHTTTGSSYLSIVIRIFYFYDKANDGTKILKYIRKENERYYYCLKYPKVYDAKFYNDLCRIVAETTVMFES